MRRSNLIYHLTNAAIFILLEIAALNMLRNSSQLQKAWISRGAHAAMQTIWGGAQSVRDYFSLGKANDRLALENHELRLKLAQFTDSLDLHGTETGYAGNFRYIHAEIAKISNNTQHNYMIINKGSDHGVTEGSGVVTGRGAVGIIDAVSRNYCYARSFKNHEMNISARLGKEGAVGPLSWNGKTSNGAILKEIPHHVGFEEGDTVYTSGFSSIFPADIPLGTAGSAQIVNGATFEIEVELFEDFEALRYVTIVENLGKDEMKELEGRQ